MPCLELQDCLEIPSLFLCVSSKSRVASTSALNKGTEVLMGMNSQCAIERLCLTSKAVKHPQYSPLYSVSLIRLQGKKVVSSTVILETQAAWHLPSSTVPTFALAQLPCRLN